MTESGDLLHGSPDLNPLKIDPKIIDALDPEVRFSPMEREMAGMLIGIGYVERKAMDSSKPGFNNEDLLTINKHVLNDALNPHRTGVLRRVPAVVHHTIRGEYKKLAFTPVSPEDLPAVFQAFSQELEEKTGRVDRNMPVGEVLDLAAWAHNRLFTMQPFYDGNSRGSRLLVDFIFRRAGLSYLTDWGSENDEYKYDLDRTIREQNPDIFKAFLARKLHKRTVELKRKNPGIGDVLSTVQTDVQTYINGLNANAA